MSHPELHADQLKRVDNTLKPNDFKALGVLKNASQFTVNCLLVARGLFFDVIKLSLVYGFAMKMTLAK